MNIILQQKQSQLEGLCRQFHAQRLEVFGSAARDDFDATTSDIDFLVEFNEEGIKNYADCYFGLLEALESLFARRVELVVISSLKKSLFPAKHRTKQDSALCSLKRTSCSTMYKWQWKKSLALF